MKLVDVTLRDGGYTNRFSFTNDEVKNIIAYATAFGADFIEVGYRNGPLNPAQGLGFAAYCNNEYLHGGDTRTIKFKCFFRKYLWYRFVLSTPNNHCKILK